MYDFSVGQMMHKAKHNELPRPLQNMFETDPNLFHYFFKEQKSRLKQTEKSIIVAGPKIWNSLPNACIQESTFQTFKIKSRQHIF